MIRIAGVFKWPIWKENSVRGINVRGVSYGLASLLFPTESYLEMAKKKEEKTSRKINEQAALMNHLDALKTANERDERREVRKREREKNWAEKERGKRWIARRNWISQLNRPPTLQIGGWIFLGPPPGVVAALKTLRAEGCGEERVLSRYGKKIHRGPTVHLSCSAASSPKKEGRWIVRNGKGWAEGKSTRVVLMAVAVVLKAKQKLGDILGRLRKHGRSRGETAIINFCTNIYCVQ